MENRIRSIFLITLALGLLTVFSSANAQESEIDDTRMIEPDVERIEFNEAMIDTEDYEILIAAGYLSIEDFGVNPLLELRFNYHIDENFFVAIALGQTEGSDTSYEVLSGGAPILTDEERELQFYRINIGYNLLPGEAFWSNDTTFNTAFYISAGIGNTEFAGDDHYTINYGAGYRFLINDALGIYTDFRNNVFDSDVFGSQKATNNLEFTLGASWYF